MPSQRRQRLGDFVPFGPDEGDGDGLGFVVDFAVFHAFWQAQRYQRLYGKLMIIAWLDYAERFRIN